MFERLVQALMARGYSAEEATRLVQERFGSGAGKAQATGFSSDDPAARERARASRENAAAQGRTDQTTQQRMAASQIAGQSAGRGDFDVASSKAFTAAVSQIPELAILEQMDIANSAGSMGGVDQADGLRMGRERALGLQNILNQRNTQRELQIEGLRQQLKQAGMQERASDNAKQGYGGGSIKGSFGFSQPTSGDPERTKFAALADQNKQKQREQTLADLAVSRAQEQARQEREKFDINKDIAGRNNRRTEIALNLMKRLLGA